MSIIKFSYLHAIEIEIIMTRIKPLYDIWGSKVKLFSGQDQEPDSTTSHSLVQQQEYQTLEIADYCQGLQFFTK